MRYSASAILFFVLLAIPGFSQTETGRQATKPGGVSRPPRPAANRAAEGAIDLLTAAEGGAAGLDGEMRAWALWQIGMAYESFDRSKALDLLQAALVIARVASDGGSAAKPRHDLLAQITGRPWLPPKLVLERDIARSIVLLEPQRAKQVLQQIDPTLHTPILVSELASQEKEGQFVQALETLKLVTAQDEMPYPYAIRLMDNFKPEQSGELLGLFLAALASYRDHAPHRQLKDDFPLMLSRFWQRLPSEVVRQAIDEILKQAANSKEEVDYSVVSDRSTSSFRSLYEYRLFQIMPVLREFNSSEARQYEEKYPVLASGSGTNAPAVGSANAPGAALADGPHFHPSGNLPNLMGSMLEQPAAEKLAAQSDSGHIDEAISGAANIRDLNLRAQAYEYIARVAAKNQDSAVKGAVEGMLGAAEKLEPSEAFRYYATAVEIYMTINQVDDAKESLEAGLKVAGKLYKKDADVDDPNTAPKAFWPSTNAYSVLLRHAAVISHPWAISLLQGIEDPSIKVAAEIALAAGWLKAPTSPSTIMITKKNGNSMSLGSRE